MDLLELWGGPEPTVNRIGDRFQDQLVLSGHQDRDDDLDRMAALGLAAVRYPVLWERISPEDPDQHDWAWTDKRLHRLRELGIRPIAGLCHHGSGPRYTDMLADSFAPGLAKHARAVAERYPWITEWTPVNEPVTTARFSALYGHWYPHTHDEGAFWLTLLNQIDAVRLSMAAIREVIPYAKLIQTDDLGRTYATSAVREQAAFDNARRWMSWDLLCGRVTPQHDLWKRLCRHGLEDRLHAIADAPCPPDIIGVNHYLTSDRFLDHRVQRYPAHTRGGNGKQVFADTEAIRVLTPPPPGFIGVLRETWERYGIPIAITEAHNGCTREEQMRWMADAWDAAHQLRAEGVDLRAVTSWALFGSCGWNTLLTAPGVYEPGAWDVSSGTPRETAMVPLLKGLPGDAPKHPVMAGQGWWRRNIRIEHPITPRPAPLRDYLPSPKWADLGNSPPVLIAGATGTLGQAFARYAAHRDIVHVLTSRAELDLADPASIDAALDRYKPWAVINAAGWVRVDDAEDEAGACMAANADGAVRLAQACAARGIPTVSFSSDLVFDGTTGRPYVESDTPAPLGVYGQSKAQAEAQIAALPGKHLMIRTAAFFSPHDAHNFAVHVVNTLSRGERLAAAADAVVTPTYVPHLCNTALDLLIDGAEGIWHLSNGEPLSWADFASRVAQATGLDPSLIDAVPGDTLGWKAKRPANAALASERGTLMPSFTRALESFAQKIAQSRTVEHRTAA
ncbi:sugar nucleotide-binding protein [Sphingomonas sp. IC-56]|uniref:family 1 glycosylhydrolase n=1 Tax=Sphingomonas sp. IC-56 TaxID=2898529 RepID=UPI001E54752C|nr:sugar nucleotide-binding protein [Sphingomonas sp. IC-56]